MSPALTTKQIAIVFTYPYSHRASFDATGNSNTRVKLILAYARALEPFRRVIDSTPVPNAVTRLDKLDQNVGCTLGLAADMLLMLNKGIARLEQVNVVIGTVVGASYSKEVSKHSLLCGSLNSSLFAIIARNLIKYFDRYSYLSGPPESRAVFKTTALPPSPPSTSPPPSSCARVPPRPS